MPPVCRVRDLVYDITDFAAVHPGGDKILLAAGGPLEPFWSLYAIHKSSEQVAKQLRSLAIGRLSAADMCDTP